MHERQPRRPNKPRHLKKTFDDFAWNYMLIDRFGMDVKIIHQIVAVRSSFRLFWRFASAVQMLLRCRHIRWLGLSCHEAAGHEMISPFETFCFLASRFKIFRHRSIFLCPQAWLGFPVIKLEFRLSPDDGLWPIYVSPVRNAVRCTVRNCWRGNETILSYDWRIKSYFLMYPKLC